MSAGETISKEGLGRRIVRRVNLQELRILHEERIGKKGSVSKPKDFDDANRDRGVGQHLSLSTSNRDRTYAANLLEVHPIGKK